MLLPYPITSLYIPPIRDILILPTFRFHCHHLHFHLHSCSGDTSTIIVVPDPPSSLSEISATYSIALFCITLSLTSSLFSSSVLRCLCFWCQYFGTTIAVSIFLHLHFGHHFRHHHPMSPPTSQFSHIFYIISVIPFLYYCLHHPCIYLAISIPILMSLVSLISLKIFSRIRPHNNYTASSTPV